MEIRPAGREVTSVGQKGVAIELKAAAMEGIGSGLEDLVDDRTAVASKLRVKRAAHYVLFCQRIWIN